MDKVSTVTACYNVVLIGTRIAAARRRAGLKQADVAAALEGNPNPSMISLIETGRNVPSLARAAEIARVLDTSLDYLVGLTDDPSSASLRPLRQPPPSPPIERSGRTPPVEPPLGFGDERRGDQPHDLWMAEEIARLGIAAEELIDAIEIAVTRCKRLHARDRGDAIWASGALGDIVRDLSRRSAAKLGSPLIDRPPLLKPRHPRGDDDE